MTDGQNHTGLMITEPVLTTEPAYRGHALKSLVVRPRYTGEKQAASQGTSIDLEEPSTKPDIPFRLPRISPQVTPRLTAREDDIEGDTMSDKMWGRFGYEEVIRIPALCPNIHKAAITENPRLPDSHNLPVRMMAPAFKNAAITPRGNIFKNRDDFSIYKSFIEKSKLLESYEDLPHFDPSPTPVSRCLSPVKSVKSIHWVLGNTHKAQQLSDKKGRGRVQGPFSREFTVTCYAPHNWLRLKLGRSKTTLH